MVPDSEDEEPQTPPQQIASDVIGSAEETTVHRHIRGRHLQRSVPSKRAARCSLRLRDALGRTQSSDSTRQGSQARLRLDLDTLLAKIMFVRTLVDEVQDGVESALRTEERDYAPEDSRHSSSEPSDSSSSTADGEGKSQTSDSDSEGPLLRPRPVCRRG